MKTPKTITVGELQKLMLDQLDALPDNAEVFFGSGDLSLYRLHHLEPVDGRERVQIQFNEIYSVAPDSCTQP